MNHKARRIVETLACERRYGIADTKGAEYSGAGKTYIEDGADTLANFKAVAKRVGGTPEQALLTYLLKHMDSITTTVREAAEHKKDPITGYYDEDDNPRHTYAKGEGIVSRLDDARNYLDLLECLLIDLGCIAEPDPADMYPEEFQDYTYINEMEAKGEINPGDTVSLTPAGIEAMAGGFYANVEAPPLEEQEEAFEATSGMVKGLDGVWRGKTIIDESVAPGTPNQLPVSYEPTMDKLRLDPETGHIRLDT